MRYKFELSDGAGRTIKKASDHPDGVSGKYSGQITVFDKVGQVADSSNVLAVDGSWIPTAEDQGKSFLFTHLTRDELSRLKIVLLPDGNTRQYDYTGCGCAGNSETRLSDELGHQTITKTDALGRLVEAIEPNTSASDGIYSKATYVYDALDRLTQIQHRGGYNPNTGAVPTQFRYFGYDGYGRLASENTPEGGIVTYTYTANDQVATRSDGRNISSAYVYNNRGLVMNVGYSDSTPTVVYNYDAYGARTSVTDGEGQTSYSYNGYRQLQSETRTFTGLAGNNYTLGYTYNQADQVKSVNYLITTGANPGAPVTVNHVGATQQDPYSLTGTVRNQSGIGIGGVTVTMSGSDSGQTATSSGGKEEPPVGQFSFTDLRTGTYTLTPSLSGYVFNPQSITYQNLQKSWTNADFTALPTMQTVYNKTVNYTYNAVGALSGVGTNLIGTDPNNTSNVLNSVSFRASGALKSLNYGNGRRLQMGYNDNRSQPISMKVDRVNNAADKIIDYSYEYYDASGNNNNRIRKITDNVDSAYTTDYLYDDYNRLANASWGTGFRYYQYDAWGNIKDFSALTLNYETNSYGAPATNRISSDGVGGSYSYDEAGNMTAGMGQSYAYDGANRMKTAGNGNSTYGYDGAGKRVRKTENGATSFYVYSAKLKQSVMEVGSTGVQRAYVYVGNKLVGMQATDGQFYWMHANHLGNSRAMTDVNGNLSYKGQFDPYGQTLSEWSASGNNNLNTKKFTGYERDAATGLDYANARMYNFGRGRFMQSDPIGIGAANAKRPESLNRYAYTENDPVNGTDPTGLNLENPGRSCFALVDWTLWTQGNDWWITINSVIFFCLGGGTGSGNGAGNGTTGGGGGSGTSPQKEIRENFVKFLDTMSDECKSELKIHLGYLKTLSQNSAKSPLIDVDIYGGLPAKDYLSEAIIKAAGLDPGKATLDDYFNKTGRVAANGAMTTINPGPAIFYRGSLTSFDGDSMYLLLHEMMHLIVGFNNENLDEALARELDIERRDGETYSDAVSRFFNSKCKEKK